jgi:predicted permease
MLHRVRGWLRALLWRDVVEHEMGDEMRLHLERTTERLMARGMPPTAAAAAARREFGNIGVIQEDARDARGTRVVEEWWKDICYATRALARAPIFTISATLVLALGIGASTAIFSAVDAVLLARLPYTHDEQLVRVFEQNSPTNRWGLSVVDAQAIAQFGHAFSGVGTLRSRDVSVAAGHDAERLAAGFIDAGFLETLGVDVVAGRRLSRDDERPEAPAVAVIGNQYAVRSFGSAAAAIDQVVTIDGIAHRVVGVLGSSDGRLVNRSADVWPILRQPTPTRRGPFGLLVVARLRPGVTIEAARHELADISIRIFPDWQAGFQDRVARLTPYSLRETIIGDSTRPLTLFVAAVALVLLIAVSNVASLSVVRSMRRRREIAVRAVLGASRGRLVRLMMAESVILSVVGGGLGVMAGRVGLTLLQRFAVGMPRLDAAHIGGRAMAVAMTVAVIAGSTIGLVLATRLLAVDAGGGALRDGTRAIGDGKRSDRARAAFVTIEFALALPVLATGALLLNSVMRLERADTGFDPASVYTTRIALPSAGYRDNASIAAFWTRVARDLDQLPGLTLASFATTVPPDDQGNSNNNFDLVDAPVPAGGAQPTVTWPGVTADFFATFGVPLREGRLFTNADTVGSRPVIVVTESWARRYFPGKSPVGRELISGGCTACPHTVVIGVVGNVTLDGLGAIGEAVFSPLTQGWSTQLNLFLKTKASEATIARHIRDVVRSSDPGAATGPVTAMEDRVYESVAQPRHWATILLAFAAAALLMAAIGIFGLLSYAVTLRRREIGVRMALGAPSGVVVGSIIVGGMRQALIGALIGLGLTVGASRWLGGALYGVSALDPPTLLAVTGGLLAVGLLASWLPARRAATIAPVEAMRPE